MTDVAFVPLPSSSPLLSGPPQLVGEVGELAELFQWRPDAEAAPGLPGWSDAERTHLGEEVSDVLLYLVQLADVCQLDLVSAVPRKIGINARKYPPVRRDEAGDPGSKDCPAAIGDDEASPSSESVCVEDRGERH